MHKLTYEQAYLQIFDHVLKHNVLIYDTAIHGPGVSIDLRYGGPRRLICVDGKLSWKKRLFVMLHEIGHLFYYSKLKLKFRRRAGSEIQANRTAIKLLKIFSEEDNRRICLEYAKYYNSMLKGSARNKFLID